MIYFFFGDDSEAREKARQLLHSLAEKKPDAPRFVFDALTWSEAAFDELLSAQGLFTPKSLVYCNKVSENALAREFISRGIQALRESPNIFLLVEGPSADSGFTSLLSRYAEKAREFRKSLEGAPAHRDDPRAAFFRMTDAFGSRDWRGAWVGIQKLYREGHAPEEIHAMLFWLVKSILLAKGFEGDVAEGARDVGMKVFPFRKALGFSRRFERRELEQISSELVSIYHEAHSGGLDFDLALEKLILESARQESNLRPSA